MVRGLSAHTFPEQVRKLVRVTSCARYKGHGDNFAIAGLVLQTHVSVHTVTICRASAGIYIIDHDCGRLHQQLWRAHRQLL